MATWMAHLRLADALLSELRAVQREAFIVGSIAPDCGTPINDKGDYSPPATVTHWTRDGRKQHINYEAFYDAYLSVSLPDERFSFYLGYYLHLISDVLWTRNKALPNAVEFKYRFDHEEGFLKKVKRDWYDQDHLFLRENPDFSIFREFSSIPRFSNNYLDYYKPDAIEKQMRYIVGFYKNGSDTLNRDFPFLTKAEMDGYVSDTTKELLQILKRKEIA